MLFNGFDFVFFFLAVGVVPATDYWLHKLLRVSRYNDDGIKGAAIRGWRKD